MEEKQMSVQAGLGMIAQSLSSLFPEKSEDKKMIILPLSEYEKLVEESSKIYKDAKFKAMRAEIAKQDITIFKLQTEYRNLVDETGKLYEENKSLERKIATQEKEIQRLSNKHNWWQLWKR